MSLVLLLSNGMENIWIDKISGRGVKIMATSGLLKMIGLRNAKFIWNQSIKRIKVQLVSV